MNAGELDRRVQIQIPVKTRGGDGGEVTTYLTERTVWARRRDLRGDERFAAAQHNPELTAVFKIRWYDGLTSDYRIVDGADVFDIDGIVLLGRRETMEITALARTQQVAASV